MPFNIWQESTLSGLHSCDFETTLGGSTFETGIWYYAGIALTDHQDYAGLENMIQVPQTILGTEFRPQLNINLLNRLRMLDFVEVTTKNDQELVCQKCFKAQKGQKDKNGFLNQSTDITFESDASFESDRLDI